jgi:hypothetical protein
MPERPAKDVINGQSKKKTGWELDTLEYPGASGKPIEVAK